MEHNRNKKRKATESPEQCDKPHKLKQDKTVNSVREQAPSPIIVQGVKEYKGLKDVLTEINVPVKVTYMNNEQVKINVKKPEHYKMLQDKADKNNWSWHTYENKLERTIKVMAKGLHPSTSEEEIKKELNDRKYKIEKVVQKITKNIEKIIRLPIYMLIFSHEEDINRIYQIDNINYKHVKIEAVRKTRLIPQILSDVWTYKKFLPQKTSVR